LGPPLRIIHSRKHDTGPLAWNDVLHRFRRILHPQNPPLITKQVEDEPPSHLEVKNVYEEKEGSTILKILE